MYNYSDEEKTIGDFAGRELRGYLTVSASQEVTADGGLVMPPLSIAILSDN